MRTDQPDVPIPNVQDPEACAVNQLLHWRESVEYPNSNKTRVDPPPALQGYEPGVNDERDGKRNPDGPFRSNNHARHGVLIDRDLSQEIEVAQHFSRAQDDTR